MKESARLLSKEPIWIDVDPNLSSSFENVYRLKAVVQLTRGKYVVTFARQHPFVNVLRLPWPLKFSSVYRAFDTSFT